MFILVDEIVITAGWDGHLSDTETIKIYPNGTLATGSCQLPDYPIKVRGAAGSIYSFQSKEKKMIICGGGWPYNTATTNGCNAFNPSTWSWVESKPMKKERIGHAMTTRTDGSIMTCGGLDASGNRLNSCETFDGNWEVVEPLPTPLYNHCLVSINPTTMVSIGGYGDLGVRER